MSEAAVVEYVKVINPTVKFTCFGCKKGFVTPVDEGELFDILVGVSVVSPKGWMIVTMPDVPGCERLPFCEVCRTKVVTPEDLCDD